jgi:HlyD family secretion protein
MKKKVICIVLAAVLALGCVLSGCAGGGDGETASVQSVKMITGAGSVGVYDSYAGLVVSQKTVEVKKDDNKTVAEIYVEEGQNVSVGDKLFAYDVDNLQFSLDKATLELEQLKNSIETYKSQIAQLEKEKKSASSSQQLSYTVEIQEAQANQREAEYNLQLKQAEVERMKATVGDPSVTAEVAGVIQSLNPDGGSDPNTGNPLPFMTIVETGTFRIKGIINEQAAQSLSIGTAVIIRSRLDNTQTWNGTVSTIDWENPVSSNNNYYNGSASDEMTQSSKYPFYVEMNSTDGLMLGQHVYIEPDFGQEEDKSDALMLPSYFINDLDSNPWVWAANGRDKLEKRKLELGAYNAELDEYEITSGLTLEDYIAYPDETLKEGMSVVKYDDAQFIPPETGGGEMDGGIDMPAADGGDMPADGVGQEPVVEDGVSGTDGEGAVDGQEPVTDAGNGEVG